MRESSKRRTHGRHPRPQQTAASSALRVLSLAASPTCACVAACSGQALRGVTRDERCQDERCRETLTSRACGEQAEKVWRRRLALAGRWFHALASACARQLRVRKGVHRLRWHAECRLIVAALLAVRCPPLLARYCARTTLHLLVIACNRVPCARMICKCRARLLAADASRADASSAAAECRSTRAAAACIKLNARHRVNAHACLCVWARGATTDVAESRARAYPTAVVNGLSHDDGRCHGPALWPRSHTGSWVEGTGAARGRGSAPGLPAQSVIGCTHSGRVGQCRGSAPADQGSTFLHAYPWARIVYNALPHHRCPVPLAVYVCVCIKGLCWWHQARQDRLARKGRRGLAVGILHAWHHVLVLSTAVKRCGARMSSCTHVVAAQSY